MVEKLDSCGKTMMKTGRRRRFVCGWGEGGVGRRASLIGERSFVAGATAVSLRIARHLIVPAVH